MDVVVEVAAWMCVAFVVVVVVWGLRVLMCGVVNVMCCDGE